MRKPILAALAALICHTALAADIGIGDPWVKGTLASQRNSSAYLELFSEEGGTIVAASSPLAQRVELREMRFELDGGPMRPATVKEIAFLPRKKLQMTPVSEHFALIGLSRAVSKGDRIPLILTLRMQSGATRELKIEAIARGL